MSKNNKVSHTKTESNVTVEPSEVELLKLQVEQLRAQNAELSKAKERKPSSRKLKGTMVTFKTQSGEEITGMGVLYYVTRHNGKLYYKAADAVTVLPVEEKKA